MTQIYLVIGTAVIGAAMLEGGAVNTVESRGRNRLIYVYLLNDFHYSALQSVIIEV